MAPWLLVVGKELFGAWRDDRRRKHEIKEADHKAAIKRVESGDNHAASADQLSLASRGWKDDYLLVLTTLPVLVVFVEPLLLCWGDSYVAGDAAKAVGQGFNALNGMPEYYWYALGVVYVDTFGFRRMAREVFSAWLRRRFS